MSKLPSRGAVNLNIRSQGLVACQDQRRELLGSCHRLYDLKNELADFPESNSLHMGDAHNRPLT
jgi:hypothetical protein